tara:strand:- start:719 stop:838 length:120 start_codon:yes stop_codon:yes gene_type:complete
MTETVGMMGVESAYCRFLDHETKDDVIYLPNTSTLNVAI